MPLLVLRSTRTVSNHKDRTTEKEQLILPGKEMIEIQVNGNIEKAMRVLKRKLIREGMFRELKARRFYEKPSEKRKRKSKEAHKKRRKDADRSRRFGY